MVLATVASYAQAAQAAIFTNMSLSMSDPRVGATSNYTFEADNVSLSLIRCIKLDFDTSLDGAGGLPAGMDIDNPPTFAGDFVPTPGSWAVAGSNVTGEVQITLAGGETPASAAGRTIVLNGIVNGSAAEADMFVRVSTYSNVDCTTGPVDPAATDPLSGANQIAFIWTNGVRVSATIDPTMSFTVNGVAPGACSTIGTADVTTTGNDVPLGKPTITDNQFGCQRLNISTNAGAGYTVYTRFTGDPTYDTYTLTWGAGGTNAAPVAFPAVGTEAFGYSTDDATLGTGTVDRFTNGGAKWAQFTTANAEVAYGPAAVNNVDHYVGYQVGISNVTEAGTYVTTVIYTATPLY